MSDLPVPGTRCSCNKSLRRFRVEGFFYFRSYRWDGTHKHIGMHSVSHEAIEKAFFTSPDLHQKMAKARAPLSQPADVPLDDGFKELMRRCVQEAVDIVKEVNTISWQNEDARALAITLLLQRVRS